MRLSMAETGQSQWTSNYWETFLRLEGARMFFMGWKDPSVLNLSLLISKGQTTPAISLHSLQHLTHGGMFSNSHCASRPWDHRCHSGQETDLQWLVTTIGIVTAEQPLGGGLHWQTMRCPSHRTGDGERDWGSRWCVEHHCQFPTMVHTHCAGLGEPQLSDDDTHPSWSNTISQWRRFHTEPWMILY